MAPFSLPSHSMKDVPCTLSIQWFLQAAALSCRWNSLCLWLWMTFVFFAPPVSHAWCHSAERMAWSPLVWDVESAETWAFGRALGLLNWESSGLEVQVRERKGSKQQVRIKDTGTQKIFNWPLLISAAKGRHLYSELINQLGGVAALCKVEPASWVGTTKRSTFFFKGGKFLCWADSFKPMCKGESHW